MQAPLKIVVVLVLGKEPLKYVDENEDKSRPAPPTRNYSSFSAGLPHDLHRVEGQQAAQLRKPGRQRLDE